MKPGPPKEDLAAAPISSICALSGRAPDDHVISSQHTNMLFHNELSMLMGIGQARSQTDIWPKALDKDESHEQSPDVFSQ